MQTFHAAIAPLPAHTQAERRSHASTILALLAPGDPVSIELLAEACYGGGPRPVFWAPSLRSAINGLRRAQARLGATISCEPEGYRLFAGDRALVVLPGSFRARQGFLPARARRPAAPCSARRAA